MEPELRDSLAKYQIKFQFNPPGAPHFGGTWEREISSIKNALQVVIGTEALPEEVLLTLLIEVEGILNVKPLGYVTSDIADPDPVTPSMLLMGWRDTSLPQVTYAPTSVTKRRWQHSQTIVDHFWSQFIKSYLPTLQVWHKWQQPAENIALDSVVMIVDPQLPHGSWPVGKVINHGQVIGWFNCQRCQMTESSDPKTATGNSYTLHNGCSIMGAGVLNSPFSPVVGAIA